MTARPPAPGPAPADHPGEVLTPALSDSWMRIEETQARLAASIIARIGISFISLPPEDPDHLASGLTEVIAPYLQKVVQVDLPG